MEQVKLGSSTAKFTRQQPKKQKLTLEEALTKLGLTKLEVPAASHSLLQAISAVLKLYGRNITVSALLQKLNTELLENHEHYRQFLSCEVNLDDALNLYVQNGGHGIDVPESLIIAAICNVEELTIVVCEYAEQLGLQMTIDSPSRVEPHYDVHVLRFCLSGKTYYDGLVWEGFTTLANETQMQEGPVEELALLDDLDDDLTEFGIYMVTEEDVLESDEEIARDMEAQGIQFCEDASFADIAQTLASLPKLELRKAYKYIAYCSRRLNAWKHAKINIAVIGTTGTGKSSFVNAVRGVDADDKTGAAVSTVSECTEHIKEYPFPRNKNVVIWDLPGVGTERFLKDKYLEAIEIDRYNAFVITSNERFTETDVWLAKEIANRNKPFYFVRTKIQASIDSDKKAHKRTHDPDQLLKDIRQKTEQQVACLGFPTAVKVYLIDNYEPERYDFDQLKGDITANLPQAVQQQAMFFSLNAMGDSVIAGKVKELRRRLFASQLLIRLYWLLLGPKRAVAAVFRKIFFCYKQLGLDDESIHIQATELGLKYEKQLKEIRCKHIPHDITVEYYRQSSAFVSDPCRLIYQELGDMEKAAYELSAFRHEILANKRVYAES